MTTFDPKKYKKLTWKNWMVLHWLLNPGLVINELILGQRIPKISYLEKSQKPLFERGYIPCPHCNFLHDGRTWSTTNGTGFKNWFGLYCCQCGNIIPCLLNLTSLIILIITFPIWYPFKRNLKKKWLDKQPQRFNNINFESVSEVYRNEKWVLTGVLWGLIMFIFLEILHPWITNQEYNLNKMIIGLIIWTLGGVIFGYFNHKNLNNYKTK